MTLIAEYDSEADALQIHLGAEIEQIDYDEDVKDGLLVTVSILDGTPVGVELLSPRTRLAELAAAAEAYDLDLTALEAAAASALAAPDRVVRPELRAPA